MAGGGGHARPPRARYAAYGHYRRGVVHLFAGDGDERIHQLTAASASNAARIVLESYEAAGRAEARVVTLLTGGSPEYQDPPRYIYAVED